MVCSKDFEGKYDLKNHPQNKIVRVTDDVNVDDPRLPVDLVSAVPVQHGYQVYSMARGKYNKIVCDVCGFAYPRTVMKYNSYGLWVCPKTMIRDMI